MCTFFWHWNYMYIIYGILFKITQWMVLLVDFKSVIRNAQTEPKLYWLCEGLELLVQNIESQLWK